MENTDYEKNALEFLNKNDLKLTIKFKSYGKYFNDDKDYRNIYKFKLYNKKTKKSYSGTFGDSIYNTKSGIEPTPYSILACLNEDYSTDFIDFCNNYGYNEELRKAEKIYKAVKKETAGLRRVLNANQLEELNSIN